MAIEWLFADTPGLNKGITMRRILVTGANKGIGYAIAERILEEADDTFVFLGSRNRSRGDAAAESIGHADRLQVVEIDVASDASVDKAAAEIREACAGEPLYGIVNNAGIGLGSDDLKRVFDVNTRGIYRVSMALIPLLGEGGRIVNITSASGPMYVAECSTDYQQFFTRDDVTWDEIETLMQDAEAITGDAAAFAARGLGSGAPYGISKACANSLNMYLAREYSQFVINAVTPGFIATDLTRTYEKERGMTVEEMGGKTPREGATAPLFLLFGEPEGSGHYYGSDSKRSPLDRYRAPGT